MSSLDIYDTKKGEDLALQALMNRVPEEEKILYKSPKISNRKLELLARLLLFIGFVGALNFMVFFFGLGLTIEDFFLQIMLFNPNILMSNLIAFIFAFFVTRFAIKLKKEYYIVLTDKQVYIYYYYRQNNAEGIQEISLVNLSFITFRKKLLDIGKDKGTIKFYFDKTTSTGSTFFLIKRATEIPQLQNMLESAQYQYGNIKSRWTLINEKVKVTIPYTSRVSIGEYKRVKKRLFGHYLGFGIGFLAISIIFFIIRFTTNDISMIIFYILISFIFLISFIIPFLAFIYPTIKHCSSLDHSFVLNNNEISYYEHDRKILTIQLNCNTSLEFTRICEYGYTPARIKKNILGLKVKEAYNSKNYFYFGPIEDFLDYREFLYCFVLTWKNENGFLTFNDL